MNLCVVQMKKENFWSDAIQYRHGLEDIEKVHEWCQEKPDLVLG